MVPGVPVRLESPYVIPVPPTKVIARKWLHYLSLDRREFRQLSPDDLAKQSAHTRSQVRWFLREFTRIRFGGGCASPLPVHREMMRVGFYLARHTLTLTERAHRRVGASTRPV
ncbi:hypothetical protein N801_07555 [Knoellia aerolata DSM 18566]|uniref:Uncharacterized protein n=1 Tax=Knoellia aerolata DSM 18566 TaxID=1385519 RepID=A0A0A0JZ82_9MICO|nr:hypothetical protein N801_07555 [Knoellia aerolata DSM 18566]